MTEIKALEELRDLRDEAASKMVDNPRWVCARAEEIADEIEAEIAERFMELPQGWTREQAADVLAYWPKWDDDSPCMFGDEFTCYPKYCCEKKYETLDRLSIFGPNHVWDRGYEGERPHDGGYYEWNYMRPGGDGCEEYRPTKRKLRTLEDVLFGFWHEFGRESEWKELEGRIGEYADEIRELLGVDE